MEVLTAVPSVSPQNNPAAPGQTATGQGSHGQPEFAAAFQEQLSASSSGPASPADQTGQEPVKVTPDKDQPWVPANEQSDGTNKINATSTSTGRFFNTLLVAQPQLAAEFEQHLAAIGAAPVWPVNQSGQEPVQAASGKSALRAQVQSPSHRTTPTDAGGTSSALLISPFLMTHPVVIPLPVAPPTGASGSAEQGASQNSSGKATGLQSASTFAAKGPDESPRWSAIIQAPTVVFPDLSKGEMPSSQANGVTASEQLRLDAAGKTVPPQTAVTNGLPAASTASRACNSQELTDPAAASTSLGHAMHLQQLSPKLETQVCENPLPPNPVGSAPTDDTGVTAAMGEKPGSLGPAPAIARATAVSDPGDSTNSAGSATATATISAPSAKPGQPERQSTVPLSVTDGPLAVGERTFAGKLAAQVQANAPVGENDDDELGPADAGKAVLGRTPAGTAEALSVRLSTDGTPLLKWIPQPAIQTAVSAKSQRSENAGEPVGSVEAAQGSSSAESGKAGPRQDRNPDDSNHELPELTKSSTSGNSQPESDFAAFAANVASAVKESEPEPGGTLPSEYLHAVPLPSGGNPAPAPNALPAANSAPDSHSSQGAAEQAVWGMAREQAGSAQTAGLVSQGGKTEMRVDLRSDSLGAVAVRAVLNGGELGAQIQVSSHEAHAALMAEVSALERSLVSKGIQVGSLDISQGMANGGGQSQKRFGGERGSPSSSPVFAPPPPEPALEDSPASGGQGAGHAAVSNRLSVLA